jgi:hypothetical protein
MIEATKYIGRQPRDVDAAEEAVAERQASKA